MKRKVNKRDKVAVKLLRKKRKMTISLVVITFAFLIMTLPSTIYFGYFDHVEESNNYMGTILDSIGFLNRTSVFFTSFLTNQNFRKTVKQSLKCKKVTPRRLSTYLSTLR